MKNLGLIALLIGGLLNPLNVNAHSKRNTKKGKNKVEAPAPEKKKEEAIKPYDKVITKDAVTDEGLFKIHKIKDKYFFEIQDSLLNKDMLLVSRMSKLPSNLGGGYMNAGSKANEQLITWERFQDKILIKVKSYNAVANDSLPINISVKANNYEPVLYAFDIETISKDSSAVVIDVTKFYTSDVKAISGLSSRLRDTYKVRNLDNSRSFITSAKSFPLNIEIIQDFTYNASKPPMLPATETISLQMNQSMVLLPTTPMQPRLADPRVGFFTVSQYDYSSEALKSDEKTYIRRWRLEPKDPEAYRRGELVEPIKPIVYYLDPATPEKLRKYIKQGIEEWQKPFETAGFKNAIIAKDPPTYAEDPDFSPEDIRYSVVRYVASTTRNAVGPSVSDPRTGEIIESDIIWYHNHLRSYRNRYMLETGAANPSARTLETSDEEIGEMMRMVIAHEVGHALGFPHNMAASHAYDVESYRNGAFTQEHGIAASIMDYARYNYIAQPGDENIRFVRQIGPYDHYVTNWGYRWIPGATTEGETPTLDQWVMDKADDPRYKYGKQSSRFDPSSQTEDIGNNSIKASTYGLKNLKYVAEHLPEWTSDITNDYDDLRELQGELLSVWNRYMGHVTTHIGGVYEDTKKPNQGGVIYTPASKADQKAAMAWLQENTFSTPTWMVNFKILRNIDHAGYTETFRNAQARHLNSILDFEVLGRLIDGTAISKDNYSALEMLQDLRKGIWKELNSNQAVDVYRRNLQRAYIDRMAYLMTDELKPGRGVKAYNVNQSDVRALVRGELNTLKTQLNSRKNTAANTETKYHYQDAVKRIDLILDPK
ncbi:zinc-dependent metalloprotease [Gelidibacter maritimus]|uniref:Zinc-dependent metalloprotease n=1 Tax=Gelidibacter maritimus TaxID=2761487 RepID=A0A7W2M7L4_9FLAO|nr:zinc-dependent metalloprotease [Gelidibacter maritimus]MBA6154143.1 zinc-dependent metalloprotease [Gelidibacter maritimus]